MTVEAVFVDLSQPDHHLPGACFVLDRALYHRGISTHLHPCTP